MPDTIAVIAGNPGENTYIVDVVLGGLESMLTFGAEHLIVATTHKTVRVIAEARHRCEVIARTQQKPHILIVFGNGEQRMINRANMMGVPWYRILQWGRDE